MKVFTYSEARQNFSKLLLLAENEEVTIQRKDGGLFSLTAKNKKQLSPFDVPGINTKATTQDIVSAVERARKG